MNQIDSFRFTIIGAGVIGLAIARRISEDFRGDYDVLVVEKEESFGKGISSRNSEVIHSGIYYPTDSLKHRLCVLGSRMLYDYCEQRDIAYNKCGKFIIATDDSELEAIERLYFQAAKNNVENVILLDRKETLKLEPDISAIAAVFSRETGIFDTHSFMKSMEGEILDNNGTIVYGSKIVSIRYDASLFYLELADGTRFASRYVVNSAGLYATAISKLLGIEPARLYPCKGTYFSYAGRHRCRHLIYPVPHSSLTGLGIHATIDLGGRLKFGPDAEYIDDINDYSVDGEKKVAFYRAARRIFKDLDYEELAPDMVGLRPKIQGPLDRDAKDFYIKDEAGNGFPRFINLLGIESPGLTSALAIGQYVYDLAINS